MLVFRPGAGSKATGGVTGERSHYAYSGGCRSEPGLIEKLPKGII